MQNTLGIVVDIKSFQTSKNRFCQQLAQRFNV